MPLAPIAQLVQSARAQSYALGYFESWNLESLQGVLDAAVVRVYEATGKATPGIAMKLSPKVVTAHEANLLEDPGPRVRFTRNTLHFDLHPLEIRTFELHLRPLLN